MKNFRLGKMSQNVTRGHDELLSKMKNSHLRSADRPLHESLTIYARAKFEFCRDFYFSGVVAPLGLGDAR